MTRKAIGVGQALLSDENGQTMLEYVVIIIFVITCTIIFFRLVKRIVHSHVMRASASFDTD
jgi:Flp pilus assembly pilin Flp